MNFSKTLFASPGGTNQLVGEITCIGCTSLLQVIRDKGNNLFICRVFGEVLTNLYYHTSHEMWIETPFGVRCVNCHIAEQEEETKREEIEK